MRANRRKVITALVGCVIAMLGFGCTGIMDIDTGGHGNKGQGLGQGNAPSNAAAKADTGVVGASNVDAGRAANGTNADAAGGTSIVEEACQNKSAGETCAVEKRGNTLFEGECTDLADRAICLPQDVVNAGAGGDAGSVQRPDVGISGDAGIDAVTTLEDACANKSDGDACQPSIQGRQLFDGTCQSFGGRTLCTPDVDIGSSGTSADAGGSASGSVANGPVTAPCENKSRGEACTVEVAGRTIYDGTCNEFGICVR